MNNFIRRYTNSIPPQQTHTPTAVSNSSRSNELFTMNKSGIVIVAPIFCFLLLQIAAIPNQMPQRKAVAKKLINN
jgi:hypothetical protein